MVWKHTGSNGARNAEDATFKPGKGSMQQSQSVRDNSKRGHHCAWGLSGSTAMHVRPSSTTFASIGVISVHGGQKYGNNIAVQEIGITFVPAAFISVLFLENTAPPDG